MVITVLKRIHPCRLGVLARIVSAASEPCRPSSSFVLQRSAPRIYSASATESHRYLHTSHCYLKKKKEERVELDLEEDEDDEDELEEPGEQVIIVHSPNRRLDTLSRIVFRLSLNNTDAAIHSGKIRINGKLPSKRAVDVMTGDVVDFLRRPNEENAKLMDISRFEFIEVDGATTGKGKLQIKIKKYENLSVPDYS